MKKLITFLIACVLGIGQSFSYEYLLKEEFENIDGDGSVELTTESFNHPEGWSFTNAYTGPQCIVIKKGGTITTPPLAELKGNALFSFGSINKWGNEEGDFDSSQNTLSISGGGELSSSSYYYTIMDVPGMYNVTPETRITLTAAYDLSIRKVEIYRGENVESDLSRYCSHKAGDYYTPFDLSFSLGEEYSSPEDRKRMFFVYTLDGSTPTFFSTRYDGTPIHIESTTSLRLGLVSSIGSLIYDKEAQVYNFDIPEPTLPETPSASYEISVSAPGQLQAEIKKLDADVIEGLVVKGKINGEDLAYLNSGTGRMGSLAYLNLSDVTFEYDGTEYAQITFAPEGGMGTTTVCHYVFSEENWNDFRNVSPSLNQDTRYRNDLSAAFYRHPSLKHVVLPSMLTGVGEYAFSKCDKLEAVTTEGKILNVDYSAFSSSREFYYFDLSPVEKIGIDAFGWTNIRGAVDLSNAKEIGVRAFNGAKINYVTFGERPRIGEGAFSYNKISVLNLPAPPDSIPADAFSCETLKEVTIGEGLKYIGDNAFGSSVEELNLPNSVEEMGKDVIPKKILAKIEAEDGIKYIGKVAYSRDSDQTSYTIKEGTVSLSPELFYMSNVESITLPSSLKIIGDQAFYGAKLKKTPDMQGVVRIGDQAFMYNTDMAKAVLPENLELIGSWVFEGNSALWSLEFNCIDLKDDTGYGISLGNVNLEEIKIGQKVRRIPGGLYGNSSVEEIEFPASVEVIDDRAFYNCSKLKSVKFNGPLKSLGQAAFGECRELEEIPMLDVDSIPDWAFDGCKNLKTLRLSDRVKKIGMLAFKFCSSLKDFHWPLALEHIGNSAFYKCESLENISLPEGFKRSEDSFYGCSSINTIYIPSTIILDTGEFFSGLTDDLGVTVTCMLAEPPAIKNSAWNYNNRVALAKVPAASLEAYKAHPDWAFLGDNIIPVEGISAPAKTTVTAFSGNINEDTDLSDTVIGDVYVTLGKEDTYDAEDGSIVLGSTIENQYAEILGGLVPGESDLANRFNGLVVKVGEGEGSVKIDCQTVGSNLLTVKMGAAKPQTYTKSEKGTVDVPYNVATPTYIYVYGTLPENSAKGRPAMKQVSRAAEDGCIRVYSMMISPNNAPLETEVENVTLSKTELTLTEGEIATLTATVLPEDATDKTVTWSSSDEAVATVSSEGVVTAVKAGTATITVTSANGKTATCTVTVSAKVIEVTEISISQATLTLTEGETATLTATVLPEDATDKTVTWTSSDESVATVSSEGVVTAVKAGTATITVTSANGKTATCAVTVADKMIEVTEISISRSELTLTEGETATLTATVLPEDATDKTVYWTSGDESIATVSPQGTVTAVKAGTTTIVAATANGKYATCFVTVEPAVILSESLTISPENWSGEEGSTFTITATVSPENTTDKSLTWESSDETVATVDAEGNVTVLKEGTCEITVSTNDGTGLTAKCVVSGLAGIDLIFADPEASVDVYNMQGVLLKHKCTLEDLKRLQPAMYILRPANGKSFIFVKHNN